MMSVGTKTIKYTAAAAIVAVALIGASFLYIGIPVSPGSSTKSQTSTGIAGPTSTLLIQLTDPPHVPPLTTSLNMTYSSIGVLVGEPSTVQGQETTSMVVITPQGGNATIDLLKLQNLSQTLASATLPSGSIIYSVRFNVTDISIDVNNTVSQVTFASGSSSLMVTIAEPTAITGTNVALLQLNPVVVDTPTGYQMIPSAVGVLQHDQGQGESQIGSQHQLTHEDYSNLTRASANATITLSALSVSGGNVTNIVVTVNNTGTLPIVINGVGIHGNFTVQNSCQPNPHSSNHNDTTSQTDVSNHTEISNHTETTTTNTTESSSHDAVHQSGYYDYSAQCEMHDHPSQIVLIPGQVMASSGSGVCSTGNMSLVNGEVQHEQGNRSTTLNPGQCVQLTFNGIISFGSSQQVLVPSTLSGQSYGVSLIASNGANQQISCVLPLGPGSCTTAASKSGDN